MKTKKTIFYVCGGMYEDLTDRSNPPKRDFGLVHPSRDELPYVAPDIEAADKLFWSTEHHSHLYSVDIVTGRMELVRQSTETSIPFPSGFVLAPEWLERVRKAVTEAKFILLR